MRSIAGLYAAICSLVFLPGCLKESGDGTIPGIGFSADTVTNYRLDIIPGSQPVNSGVVINLIGTAPSSTDIQITLSAAESQSAIDDYNTAHGTSIQVLPAANFTLSSQVTLVAGQQNIALPLTILNAASLNFNQRYGMAVSIENAGSGYTIPANLRSHIFIFSLLNIYDGKYRLNGEFYHPLFHEWFSTNQVEMHTTGPNSVMMYSAMPGLIGYLHPVTWNGNWTTINCIQHMYFINSANNQVMVQNHHPSCDGLITMGPGYLSRWDQSAKTIYAQYGYRFGPGGIFIPDTTRLYTDTLVWLGPR